MPPSRPLSRAVLAGGLILAPLLLLAAGLTDPTTAAEDERGLLAAAATDPDALAATEGLYILAGVALIPAGLGLIRLIADHAPRLALVGGGGVALGGLGLVAVEAGGFYLRELAASGVPLDQQVSIVEGTEGSAAMLISETIHVAGLIGGMVVAAVGLFRARAVPAWAPVALVAGMAGLLAFPGDVGRMVAGALLVAALAFAGLRLLGMSKEPADARERSAGMVALTLLAIVVAGLAGCGGDEDPDGQTAQAKRLAVELTQSGNEVRFSVPKTVPAGLVRIDFTSKAKGQHSAQLVGLNGHTAKKGLKAVRAWFEEGRPLPAWVSLPGGVGSTPQGTTRSAIQRLSAGSYFLFDTDADKPEDTVAGFQVTGGGRAPELPGAPAAVKAAEYTFNAVGLKMGKNRILFDNTGTEPHFFAAEPIKPGRTIADVRRFVRDGKGKPPVDARAGTNSPVIDGGVRQVIELDLKKSGKYALICYVADRKGGPPHAFKGMISEAVAR
jgi:hypothetical protein